MAQGEQLHLTTWPPLWPSRRAAKKDESSGEAKTKQYDNLAANRTRTAAHCFEAKCFGVLCSGFMDKEMRGTYFFLKDESWERLTSAKMKW